MPYHYVGDQLQTLAISGLSRVRTELFQLLVVPSLAPHPVETNRKFPRHGNLGDPSLPSHGQVEKLAHFPLWPQQCELNSCAPVSQLSGGPVRKPENEG
jgi:hypothetical protein